MQKKQQSKQGYLRNLGKLLLWFFPFEQVLEILSDYENFFHEKNDENSSTELVIKNLGIPREVLREILAESPHARSYFFKWIGFWGILMLASVYLLFQMENGFWEFLFLFPLSVFGLVHGWERWGLERRFPIEKSDTKFIIFAHCLLPVLILLTELFIQSIFDKLNAMPYEASLSVGRGMGNVYSVFQVIVILLLLWMLVKMVCSSAWYYLGVLHALGAFLSVMNIKNVWHAINIPIPEAFRRDFWICLSDYGICLCLAAFLILSFRLRISKKGNR